MLAPESESIDRALWHRSGPRGWRWRRGAAGAAPRSTAASL